MIREKYSIQQNDTSLSIVQGKVAAVRSKDIQKTAIRIYDDRKIAVAGAYGKVDEDALTRQAREGLELNIPYPLEPEKNKSEKRRAAAELEESQILEEAEAVLAQMRQDQPDYIYSNKIYFNKMAVSLSNDCGLDLQDTQTIIEFALIVKAKDSSNIFDALVGYNGRKYDRKELLRLNNIICDAYKNKLELKSGEYPIVFLESDFTYKIKLLKDLNGLLWGSGGSYFSDKVGKKIFHDNFTVYQSRNAEDGNFVPFFDAEGVSNSGDRFPLIENGVIKHAYTSKLYAKQFNLVSTGSADGEFDSVPNIGTARLSIKPSAKTMKEILNGQPGIFVMIAFGGDFTPEGSFGTPVQLAFQFDGEKFIGRLPEFKLSGHLNTMFGDGFLGVSNDSLSTLSPMRTIAMKMKVDV